MRIEIDDLNGKGIADFLEEHVNEMKSVSPPESKHALDLESLKESTITFWSVYDGVKLVGCGALKELGNLHGEVKSMRTSASSRGLGIASKTLSHIINVSLERNYTRLSLETGAMPFFEPARSLYRNFGFIECEPFSGYKEDVNSVFMELNLNSKAQQ